MKKMTFYQQKNYIKYKKIIILSQVRISLIRFEI